MSFVAKVPQQLGSLCISRAANNGHLAFVFVQCLGVVIETSDGPMQSRRRSVAQPCATAAEFACSCKARQPLRTAVFSLSIDCNLIKSWLSVWRCAFGVAAVALWPCINHPPLLPSPSVRCNFAGTRTVKRGSCSVQQLPEAVRTLLERAHARQGHMCSPFVGKTCSDCFIALHHCRCFAILMQSHCNTRCACDAASQYCRCRMKCVPSLR